MVSKKNILYLVLFLLFVVLYFSYDPSNSSFFPKCPFFSLTGLQCPGCGSQRAVHDLLHGEFSAAFRHHPLLVISIPYLVAGFIFEMKKNKSEAMLRWRNALFGLRATYIVLAIVIAYWILRNL